MLMISKEQLQRIAITTGLPLYQQEKDYLLKLFLYFYYKHFKDALFKGGTCLKYMHNLDRFSEDLDFNIKRPALFQEQVRESMKQFEKIGIDYFFIKEELFEDSYTCEIGFHGPLYAGNSQTQNKFRIDAGYRTGTFKKAEWRLIKSEYPETEEHFLIFIMNEEEIFIEKILTLFSRKKGRDLFDVWHLMNKEIKFDKKLLTKKSKIEKIEINFNNLISKKEYERDMFRLTSRVLPYEQVKKDVEEYLKKKI